MEIHDALIVRVVRKGEALGFRHPELRIEPGDKLVIVGAASGPPVSAS